MVRSSSTEQGTVTPRVRGVSALIASSAISSVGDGASVAAMPLLAAFLTRDPLAVSIVSGASAAPWVLVGLWSGALVDRLPRKLVMVVADLIRALALALLAILVVLDSASVWILAIAAFLVTAGRAFFDAAAQAIVPQIVGKTSDALSTVNGRLVASETAGRSLAGPPLGGLTFSLSPWLPFAMDAVSFATSAAILTRLPSHPKPDSERQSIITAAVEGFRYLFVERSLLLLASISGAYNFAYNLAFGVFVLYAQDVLHLNDFGFGLLLAAGSVGAIVAGWRVRSIASRLGVRGGVFVSVFAQAIGWTAIVVSESIVVAAIAIALLGAASTLITVSIITARQQQVPDRLLGRVVSAFRLFGNGAAPIGAAVGGLLASAYGLPVPLWTAAGIALLAAVGVAALRPHRL